MTQKNQNFTMSQGEDKTITVNLYNGSGVAYGSTVGLTFYWKVYTSDQSTTALISKSSGSGIVNGTSLITITLAKADTYSLSAPVTYYHECRVVDGTGKEDVVFAGALELDPSPTK